MLGTGAGNFCGWAPGAGRGASRLQRSTAPRSWRWSERRTRRVVDFNAEDTIAAIKRLAGSIGVDRVIGAVGGRC